MPDGSGLEPRVSCGGSIPCLGLDELRDGNVATFAHAPPVDLDSRDFMESFGGEVAGSAMWAANNWHFLNYKQCRASSVATRHQSNLNTSAATVFAACLFTVIPHIQ